MKRITAFLVAGLLSVSAVADDDSEDFVGLWSGVDDLDGSSALVSITDSDGDGTLDIRWSEPAWRLCGGAPQGLVSGTARAEGNTLTGSVTVTCFLSRDLDQTIDPFTLIKLDDSTIACPETSCGNTIPLHRISASSCRSDD